MLLSSRPFLAQLQTLDEENHPLYDIKVLYDAGYPIDRRVRFENIPIIHTPRLTAARW